MRGLIRKLSISAITIRTFRRAKALTVQGVRIGLSPDGGAGPVTYSLPADVRKSAA